MLEFNGKDLYRKRTHKALGERRNWKEGRKKRREEGRKKLKLKKFGNGKKELKHIHEHYDKYKI